MDPSQQAVYATDEVQKAIVIKTSPVVDFRPSMGGLLSSYGSKQEKPGRMVWRRSRSVLLPTVSGELNTDVPLKSHILAARTVANIIRTSLGPRGFIHLTNQ